MSFYMCPFNEKYLFKEIELDDCNGELKKAFKYFDEGKIQEGHNLCEKLKGKTEVADMMSVIFSKTDETESEFEERHIRELMLYADNGNTLAQYSLAVYFDQGDMVDQDKHKAEEYYRRAAKAGNNLAKHIYGIMLYYGTDNLEADQEEALAMLNSSATYGVEDATIFLNSVKKS